MSVTLLQSPLQLDHTCWVSRTPKQRYTLLVFCYTGYQNFYSIMGNRSRTDATSFHKMSAPDHRHQGINRYLILQCLEHYCSYQLDHTCWVSRMLTQSYTCGEHFDIQVVKHVFNPIEYICQ